MENYWSTLGKLRWWASLRQVALHIVLAALAVGIAFSLPIAARYILYQWWPLVASDASLLVVSEISLAASLVVLFNMWRLASEDRVKARVADTAALVYARRRVNWLTRLRERSLIRRMPAARDAFVLSLTGYDTFASARSPLHTPLQAAYEIRVMLLNPAVRAAERRVNSLPAAITRETYAEEVDASIAYLAALRALGRKVTLKFYEHEPFWKVVVLGDHLWVQYCHTGFTVTDQPEYVFALNRENPRLGLFVPFYMHFLEQWGEARHPRFDFDSRELVYTDETGRELRRTPFPRRADATPVLLQAESPVNRSRVSGGRPPECAATRA
ncbi:MAG TPA: hypothetical protein VH881_14420 [Burkholderiales bacterium]|jgi:hypothetical protein